MPKNTTCWRWKPFHNLTPQEVYQILRFRQQVFVVEQKCCYEDIDSWDQSAIHLLGMNASDELVAYCRVFAPAVRFPEASIGRVLTDPSVRGTGLGHEMIRRSVAYCEEQFPDSTIRIGAQAHLQRYYGAHGFVTRGAEYPIDDIPHVDMFRETS